MILFTSTLFTFCLNYLPRETHSLFKSFIEAFVGIKHFKSCDIATEFKKFMDSEVKNLKRVCQIFSERGQVI